MKVVFFSRSVIFVLRKHLWLAQSIIMKIERYAEGVALSDVMQLGESSAKRLTYREFRVIFEETQDTILVTKISRRREGLEIGDNSRAIDRYARRRNTRRVDLGRV